MCKSCTLPNIQDFYGFFKYVFTKVGLDTAENEFSEVLYQRVWEEGMEVLHGRVREQEYAIRKQPKVWHQFVLRQMTNWQHSV